MSDLALVNSFASVSNKQLHAMRAAIDTVLHRREGGLPPRPEFLRYFSLAGEKACQIEGFSSYAVTESGRVYSYKSSRYIQAAASAVIGVTIHLKYPGGKRTVLVHRLVAIYFLSKPDDCDFVRHIDGNKLNNLASNLCWARLPQDQGRIGLRNDNKTGFRGVTKLKTGKFAAILRGAYLGCFPTAEEAAAEYNRHALESGFGFQNSLPVAA